MKSDIEIPTVHDVAVAICKEEAPGESPAWNVYLINLKKGAIENVLVTSRGYGQQDGEKSETSTLRHFFEKIPAESSVLIEPIVSEVFELTNEYWVSFYINREIFDKRYIYVPESISENNFTQIPVLNKMGVLIN